MTTNRTRNELLSLQGSSWPMLFVLSLCILAVGKCIETDSWHLGDVMIKDGVQHRASPSKRAAEKIPCQPLPRATLEKIMGAAFMSRYMSIDKPEAEGAVSEELPAGQKDQGYQGKRPPVEAFHVHEGFTRILYDEPVMDYYTNNMVDMEKNGGGSHNQRATKDFAVTETLPDGHRKRHHHDSRTAQDGRGKKVNRVLQNKKSGQRNVSETKGHAGWNRSTASLETFKMDDFEQGEPPDEPSMKSATLPSGQHEEMYPASVKFVKSVRGKRTLKSEYFDCDSRIEWEDLGADHFPRFLRRVVCHSKECWFGFFQCQPNAFTVKVLRRRKDSCKRTIKSEEIADEGIRDENSFVPPEFREQWVFEERAVTSCCECKMKI